MKRFLLLVLVAFMFSGLNAQRLDEATISRLPSAQQLEARNYLKQAKNAKTTALALNIGGAGLITLAVGIVLSDVVSYDDNNNREVAADVLTATGLAAELASIPFWIKVHKKRNLVRAIVSSAGSSSLQPSLNFPRNYPVGVGLAISLGR